MDILEKIVAYKKQEVAASKKEVSLDTLKDIIAQRTDYTSLTDRLNKKGNALPNIIAEIKRASPSKGSIHPGLDPVSYARRVEKAGAAALSVLTDARFFSGSHEDLKTARAAVCLPVLRKDFIISSYQIYESASMGADAVLLIVRILSSDQLRRYLELSNYLGLDALVETHSRKEIRVATAAGATLIGINNRDLGTFNTRIDTSIRLSSSLEKDQTAVAESGIHSRKDIEQLAEAGIHNFLIGESLVRAKHPDTFLKELLGQTTPHAVCNE